MPLRASWDEYYQGYPEDLEAEFLEQAGIEFALWEKGSAKSEADGSRRWE